MAEARRACEAWFMAQPETSGRSGSDSPDVGRLTYEQARDELVDVVRRLESGSAPLETSLALWERGEALADRCQQVLDGARERLDERLAARAEGGSPAGAPAGAPHSAPPSAPAGGPADAPGNAQSAHDDHVPDAPPAAHDGDDEDRPLDPRIPVRRTEGRA